jgi:hypothetical protein
MLPVHSIIGPITPGHTLSVKAVAFYFAPFTHRFSRTR